MVIDTIIWIFGSYILSSKKQNASFNFLVLLSISLIFDDSNNFLILLLI